MEAELIGDYRAVKQVEIKYYKYIDKAFTPPVLTADKNGTLGGYWFGMSASNTYGSNYAWHVFDGLNSATGQQWASTVIPCYLDLYSPEPIKITNITVENMSTASNYGIASGYISVSDNGTDWTQITTYTNDIGTAKAQWDIDLSNNTNYYKYYRIGVSTKLTTYVGIGELYLTAYTKDKQESTSSDYDFSQDETVYKSTKLITSVEVPYTIPTLSSNGTMGGSTFACTSANNFVYLYQLFNYYPYKLVDTGSWISWYYPTPVRITSIIIDFDYLDSTTITGKLQASNDNSTWIDLTSFSEDDEVMDGIDITPTGHNFYSYYRIIVNNIPTSSTYIYLMSLHQNYMKPI